MRGTLARAADKFVLYQAAVQVPEAEIRFAERVHLRHAGRLPKRLREDFCGTGLLAAEWTRSRDDRTAVGVDLDRATLAWGKRQALERLGPEAMERLALLRGDVRTVRTEPADVVAALNFSYCCFHSRDELVRYFRATLRALRPGGLLVLDAFGGWEAAAELTERRRVGAFTYVWEQADFDPVTNRIACHIHFRFRDGSELRRAFSYDWRLWSLPEIRDALADAGFAASEVYWEQVDRRGRGNGIFRRVERTDPCESFVAYVVGVAPRRRPAGLSSLGRRR